MTSISRTGALLLSFGSLGLAIAGTAFCILQVHLTARTPHGDGSGMQWIILSSLTLFFLLMVVPFFLVGIRGLRLLRRRGELQRSDFIPAPVKVVLAVAGALLTFLSLLF